MNKENYLEKLEKEIFRHGFDKDYVKKCKNYASRLLENNLPVIFDLTHLSMLIGIDKGDLASILYAREKYIYKKVKIPKKSIGYRELSMPTINLKYIQRWILDNLLVNMHISYHSTGFSKKDSILENAKRHLNKTCIVNLDIKDFFPSVDVERVFKLFYYYGYTKQVSFILSKLCTYEGALPQGAPTSPCLSNIICLKLDKRISELCKKYNSIYTRYADDITISGNKGIIEIIPIINKIIEEEGFRINIRKTRSALRNQRQEITGLNINSGKVTVPQKYKRKLKSDIYYCKKYGVNSHMKHEMIDKAFYKEHLYGKAYYIHMIEPNEGIRFLKKLDEIEWEY